MMAVPKRLETAVTVGNMASSLAATGGLAHDPSRFEDGFRQEIINSS
jgi:hypothetical protein